MEETKKGNKLVVIIICLVVGVLAGVGCYLFGGTSRTKCNVPTKEKDNTEEAVKYNGIDISKCLNCGDLAIDTEMGIRLNSLELSGVNLIPKENKLIASVDWYELDLSLNILNKKTGDSGEYEIKNINAKEIKMIYARSNGQAVGYITYAFLMGDGTVKVLDMFKELIDKEWRNEPIELVAKDVDDVKDVISICTVHPYYKDSSKGLYGNLAFAFIKEDGSYYIY